MTLEELFQKPELAGLTDEQALAYGNQSVAIDGSDELWSYSGVAVRFGDQAAEGLLAAIQGAGLVGAAQVYLTRGMQLSLPQVQDKLTTIGLAHPDLTGVCNALKEIGITHGTRWVQWNVAQPTLEEITTARLRPSEQEKIASLLNETIIPYASGENATLTGLLNAIAAATN